MTDLLPPTTPDELISLLIEQVQQTFPDAEIAHHADQLVVARAGRIVPIALSDCLRAYREAPEQFEVLIGNVLSSVAAPPPERGGIAFEALRDRILPMLKPAQLLKEAARRGLPRPASRPFLGDLIVTYVVEEPQRLVYLNERHLERWTVGEAHLHEVALPNLRRRTKERGKFTVSGDEAQPLIIAASGDGFDATRILLPELLDNWQRHMPGRLLIAVPTRDLLVAFSDDDTEVVERIARQVARDATGVNGLTAELFCLTDGELRIYSGD